MSTADIVTSVKNAPQLCRATFRRLRKMFETCMIGLGGVQYILRRILELTKAEASTLLTTEDTNYKETRSSYIKYDARDRSVILQLVTEEFYYLIESKETARDMWETVQFLPTEGRSRR